MALFTLDEPALEEIEEKLPDMRSLYKLVLLLDPNIISKVLPPDSSIPVAAVCLIDATNTLAEARFALFQGTAHKKWYFEKVTPPKEGMGLFSSRFFFDDVALRLYAAGEHLAEAIINMLELTKDDLQKYQPKNKDRASKQITVGKYLAGEKPEHVVTDIVAHLARSPAWRDSMNYRSTWVHEQPPLVEGTGIGYERRKRWQPSPSRMVKYILIEGGDTPTYTVDKIEAFIRPATHDFYEALRSIINVYRSQLKMLGFSYTEQGIAHSGFYSYYSSRTLSREQEVEE